MFEHLDHLPRGARFSSPLLTGRQHEIAKGAIHARSYTPSPITLQVVRLSTQKTEVVIDFGPTRLYQLRKDGEFASYKTGGSRKFTVRSIEAYLQRQPEAERTARAPVDADIGRGATEPTLEKAAHKSDSPATAPATTPPRRKWGTVVADRHFQPPTTNQGGRC